MPGSRHSRPAAMKVFYSSPWVPAEWIEAHGLQPCGVWFAEDLGWGALPLSAGVCAFSEAVLRFAETHHDAAVIFTTACDQMRRSFDAFAGSQPARAFLFNLPATWQSPVALRIFRAEVERLGRFLQAHGGHAPTAKNLAQIIERRSQSRKQSAGIGAALFRPAICRSHRPVSLGRFSPRARPSAGAGFPRHSARHCRRAVDGVAAGFAGLDRSRRHTDRAERHRVRRTQPVASVPAGRIRVTIPSARSRGGYFENCVDVFQRPNTRLYSWLGERLTARDVRGIVLWVHTGCDLWRAEAQTLRETFRLPVLLLEAEEVSGGSPREAGRIQAFVETFQMNTAPRKLSLAEWDERYAQLRPCRV